MLGYDRNILIQNINYILKERRITQQTLVTALNKSQSSISKYLNGTNAITVEFVYEIAQYLHVSLDELFAAHEPADEEATKFTVLPEDNEVPSSPTVYEVCASIATIFKSRCLDTVDHLHKETVYEQDRTEFGEYIGYYHQLRDKENLYTALLFSNYVEPSYKFDSEEEYEDYYQYLRECGNANTNNIIINSFIAKLTDLLTIYRKDSITFDSYIQAIEKNLEQIPKK